jgi:hypothetical protein
MPFVVFAAVTAACYCMFDDGRQLSLCTNNAAFSTSEKNNG